METLGQRIRRYRIEKGLTQRQLAELIGAKHNSISDWEKDKNKPYADTIELLCGVFGIQANDLLGWNNPDQCKKDAEADVEELLNDPNVKAILPMITKLDKNDVLLIAELITRLTK